MNQRRFARQHIPDRQAIARLIRVCRRELYKRQWARLANSWGFLASAPFGLTGYVAAWWFGLQMKVAQVKDEKQLSDALSGGNSTAK